MTVLLDFMVYLLLPKFKIFMSICYQLFQWSFHFLWFNLSKKKTKSQKSSEMKDYCKESKQDVNCLAARNHTIEFSSGIFICSAETIFLSLNHEFIPIVILKLHIV